MSFAEIITPHDAEESGTADQRPRSLARIWRIVIWAIAGLLVLLLVFTGWGTWSVIRAFPQTSGEVSVSGLAAEVTVQRDAQGIPTITAESSDDLFFAQGYVHAQDRFWEMDFRRHLTSGTLSELFGEAQVGTDIFLRSLDWHGVAEQEVELLSEEARAHYESYAEGVNAYLSERGGGSLGLAYTVLGLQNAGYEPKPWTPVDSVAWLKAMSWDLRTNIEDETARALQLQEGVSDEQLADLYPDYPFDKHPVILAEDPAGPTQAPSTTPVRDSHSGTPPIFSSAETVLAKVDAMIGAQGEGLGSNSWVVGGQHTNSGLPLLANDPHLGAELPSVWTQMQLRCETISEECPYAVAGFSFSGLPGIVIGHNTRVAWGFTNLTTDVADLYIERIDAEGYWQDGTHHPFEARDETIRVAGGDDVEITVRKTAHGPIMSGLTPEFTAIAEDPGFDASDLDGDEFAVSLQWTALQPGSTAEAIFALNTAGNFDEFRQAAERFDVPAQNLIYADFRGNIGYQAPGQLPIRGVGDGYLPQPGWDSAYNWRGSIPFDELPRAYNPESGYIVTANNAIVSNDYPYFLSRDWDYGYRAARIVELLESRIETGKLTLTAMAETQMDNEFPAAASLQQAYAEVTPPEGGAAEALALLADWDGQNDADSAAAAYANVLWEHVTRAMVETAEVPIPRDNQSRFTLFFAQQLADPESPWFGEDREALLQGAAGSAYDELVDTQGSDPENWNWGDLHALSLTNGTFGVSGIAPIEALFNRGPYPTGGGSSVVNATGWSLGEGYQTETVPSMRMVIDLADWDASTWQNLTGQSGHPFNAHYTDQIDGWMAGTQQPWPFTRQAVLDSTEETLQLIPQ